MRNILISIRGKEESVECPDELFEEMEEKRRQHQQELQEIQERITAVEQDFSTAAQLRQQSRSK